MLSVPNGIGRSMIALASEVVFVVYSSGTTGKSRFALKLVFLVPAISIQYRLTFIGLPKGVMLTHQNVIVNLLQTDPVNELSHNAGASVIAVLPFYHVYGELRLISLEVSNLILKQACSMKFYTWFTLV